MTRDYIFTKVQAAPTWYAEADDQRSYADPVRLDRWEELLQRITDNAYQRVGHFTESTQSQVYALQLEHTHTPTFAAAGVELVRQLCLSYLLSDLYLDACG